MAGMDGGGVAGAGGGDGAEVVMIHTAVLRAPYAIGLTFTLFLAAMGYELSSDMIRVAKMAQELTHVARVTTLNELSGSLAHALNQPLATILSNAQAAQRYLAQTPPNLAMVEEILADIVAEDLRASEVIRRLRSLLRRGEVELAPLSLNDAIEEVLELVRRDFVERGLVVIHRLAPDLPELAGDRVEIQQAILNLVLNAADAMAELPPEKRRLRITTQRHGGGIRVTVQDQGCGLPADPATLFEPFFTTKPNGLGMGLTVCRSIVDAHGGRLLAEPNPGEAGASFHIDLPVAAAASA